MTTLTFQNTKNLDNPNSMGSFKYVEDKLVFIAPESKKEIVIENLSPELARCLEFLMELLNPGWRDSYTDPRLQNPAKKHARASKM